MHGIIEVVSSRAREDIMDGVSTKIMYWNTTQGLPHDFRIDESLIKAITFTYYVCNKESYKSNQGSTKYIQQKR
jgi:hypothetical protein